MYAYMIEGMDHDDRYMMVEDELLQTAQLYTRHLHQAAYDRLRRELGRAGASRRRGARRSSMSARDEERRREAQSEMRTTTAARPRTASEGKEAADEVEGREEEEKGSPSDLSTENSDESRRLTGRARFTGDTMDADGDDVDVWAGTALHGLMTIKPRTPPPAMATSQTPRPAVISAKTEGRRTAAPAAGAGAKQESTSTGLSSPPASMTVSREQMCNAAGRPAATTLLTPTSARSVKLTATTPAAQQLQAVSPSSSPPPPASPSPMPVAAAAAAVADDTDDFDEYIARRRALRRAAAQRHGRSVAACTRRRAARQGLSASDSHALLDQVPTFLR
ncbi:hypothetical protein KEM52_000574 [Ascosphaera acerosa]|nr:hypothetical protein KEM52_000574 [Ascosphaera acerosa]